jgi:hypothetical protein
VNGPRASYMERLLLVMVVVLFSRLLFPVELLPAELVSAIMDIVGSTEVTLVMQGDQRRERRKSQRREKRGDQKRKRHSDQRRERRGA